MQSQVTEEYLEFIEVDMKWIFFQYSDVKLKEKLERTQLIIFDIISSSRDIVLKEMQNGIKSGSPIVKMLVKLWQKGQYL